MKRKLILLTLLFLSLLNLVDEKTQLVDNLYANVLQANEFQIKEIKYLKKLCKAGEEISLFGEDFGDENDDVVVNVSGDEYEIEANYGREIKFKLDEKMRSGSVFVKKTIKDKDDEVVETVESNKLYLNLGEASVDKIESLGKLFPEEEIKLYGRNLDDNVFFYCDEEELEAKVKTKLYAIVEIPNKALDCNIKTKKNYFIHDTQQNIKVDVETSYTDLFWKENSYFIVGGKNFSKYEDLLDKIDLEFDNGNKLENPTYISDTELKFTKVSVVIPAIGVAALKIDDTIFPYRSYTAKSDFVKINSITNLSAEEDGKASFEVNLSKAWSSLSNPILKVANQTATIEGNSTKIKAIVSDSISLEDDIWIEEGGYNGEKYKYGFSDWESEPKITSILVESSWNEKGGRMMRINGYNFDKKSKVKVSSNMGDMEIEKATPNAIYTQIPYETEEGDYSVSVSVDGKGNSNSVKVEVPAMKGKLFYPAPVVDEVDYPSGPFFGEKINILGENFVEVTSVSFNGKTIKPNWFNANMIEITIPSYLDKEGKLKVIVASKLESGELDYAFIEKPSNRYIELKFPERILDNEVTQTDEMQNLFAFAITNYKKRVTMDNIEFNYNKENKYPLPITEFQLIDGEGNEVEDVEIIFNANERKIEIDNLEIPVLAQPKKFILQGKVFQRLMKNMDYTFRIDSLQAKDDDNRSNDVLIDKTARETISIQALPDFGETMCMEYYQEEWVECRKNVRRPIRRPNSHWSNVNTRKSNQ